MAGLLAIAVLGDAQAQRQAASADAATLLKDYALSTCLAQAFPQIRPAASAAAGAYVEFGSHGAGDYERVALMAGEFLKRDYPSFKDADLSVMKCIDFAASREVAAIARHPAPNK